MPDLAKCRSCGAPIRWAVTERGRNAPLDPEPHPEGNLRVEVRNGLDLAIVVAPGSEWGLYRSHFASCPNATAHRRAR